MTKWAIIVGLLWGIVGINIGISMFGPIIFGGLALSPIAGLLLAQTVPLFQRSSVIVRIALSVFSVFVGAAIFGLGVGVADLLFGPAGRLPWAVVTQAVLAVLWGVLFLNLYLIGLLFWPSAYCTYLFLERKSRALKG